MTRAVLLSDNDANLCFQCVSTIALVHNEQEVLDCPIWIMLINVVALEMLKAKLPTTIGKKLDMLSLNMLDHFFFICVIVFVCEKIKVCLC